MVGFIIIGTVCVSLILTGSLPGIAYLMPYSAPLSTDGIYGRAAGVSFLLGFLGVGGTIISILLMMGGLVLLIIGLLKGVDQLRTFK
ncbi:hypothetical protein K8I28_05165 [bacterium]|nr:hypothetical protein [bacterium]